MSEVWLRLILVLAAAVIALAVVLVLRRRPQASRGEGGGGLEPGVYFFSSADCADCAPARLMIEEALGVTGFTEMRWEDHPDLFTGLGIDSVPCTVLVGEDGSQRRFPGSPQGALRALSP